MRFAPNAVRLQLHALAYNLANFRRTLATPEVIEGWSLTALRERPLKIGAQMGHCPLDQNHLPTVDKHSW